MVSSLKFWALTDIQEDKEEEASFNGCNLVDQDLDAISAVLVNNRALKRLILNANPELTGDGVAKLLRALSEESNLEEIFLWGCEINEGDVRKMTDALSNNATIKSLWLEDREKLRGTRREKEIAVDIEKEAQDSENRLDWEAGLELYKTALQIKIDELGPNHLYVADTHRRIARNCEKQDQLDAALEHYKAAWLVHIKLRDEDHLDVADSEHDIGRILAIQGELDPITRLSATLDEALDRLLKSIKIRLDKLPPNDLNIALSHFAIGLALQKKNQIDSALGKYKEALVVHVERGKDDAAAGDTYLAIAEIHADRGKWEEAKENFASASALFVQHIGAGDAKVSTALLGEANALQQTGKFMKAIDCFDAAMKIEISYIGAEKVMFSEKVAHIYLTMADCNKAFGDLPQAIEKIKMAAMCYSNLYGATHTKTEALNKQADDWYLANVKASMFS